MIHTDSTSQTHTHRRNSVYDHVFSIHTAHLRKGSPSAGAAYFLFLSFFSAFLSAFLLAALLEFEDTTVERGYGLE